MWTCSLCFICAKVKSSIPRQDSGAALLVLSLYLRSTSTPPVAKLCNNQGVSTALPSPGIHTQDYLEGFLISELNEDGMIL